MGQATARNWSEINHHLLSAYCVPATVQAPSVIARYPLSKSRHSWSLCDPGFKRPAPLAVSAGCLSLRSRRAHAHLSSTSTPPVGAGQLRVRCILLFTLRVGELRCVYDLLASSESLPVAQGHR